MKDGRIRWPSSQPETGSLSSTKPFQASRWSHSQYFFRSQGGGDVGENEREDTFLTYLDFPMYIKNQGKDVLLIYKFKGKIYF